MAVAYSQDLRDRVIAARDRGLKTKQVANLFGVSSSWVRRVVQRRREHGETGPRPRGGVTIVKIDLRRLSELVQQQPDATTCQLHERLGIDCSVSAVGMALKRLGLSFKKDAPCGRARSPRRSWTPSAMALSAAASGRTPAYLHRRDMDQDQHDASARPRAGGPTSGRQDAPWSLEDHDVNRGVGHRGRAMFDADRWPGQRRCL